MLYGGSLSPVVVGVNDSLYALIGKPAVIIAHRQSGSKSNSACKPCHSTMTSAKTPWHNMHLGASLTNLTCATCHKSVTLAPRSMAGKVLIDRGVCLRCHKDKFAAYTEDHRKPDWVKSHKRLRGNVKGGVVPSMDELRADYPDCFICHKQKELAFCGDCHQAHPHDYAWVNGGHGKKAVATNFSCLQCHEKTTWCTDQCHEGVTLPHNIPKWSRFWSSQPDAPKWRRVHFKVAEQKGRQVCQRCHKWSGSEAEKQDFCMRCHHQQFYKEFPGQLGSPWIKYAMKFVKANGANRCFQCHMPEFCVTCHTTGAKPPPGKFFVGPGSG